MSTRNKPSTNNAPAPWPVYTGNLKTAMSPADDFTIEVPRRLASLCKLYKIEQADPLWERKLLMTLLHRHIKGFRFQAKRGNTVDSVFLIDEIDVLKDQYEEKTGIRPSTDAVVTEMLSFKKENPDIADMTRPRLMRIYSGARSFGRKHRTEPTERAGASANGCGPCRPCKTCPLIPTPGCFGTRSATGQLRNFLRRNAKTGMAA